MTVRYCAVYRQPQTGRVHMRIEESRNRFTASKKLPRVITEQGIRYRRQGGIKRYSESKGVT